MPRLSFWRWDVDEQERGGKNESEEKRYDIPSSSLLSSLLLASSN
jgi:hypothetical protein